MNESYQPFPAFFAAPALGGTPPVDEDTAPSSLVFYSCDPGVPLDHHDLLTKAEVARALAELRGCELVLDAASRLPGIAESAGNSSYLVPSQTLTDLALAHRLGVRSAADLFGGVVPHPFIATKIITHPLLPGSTLAPAGWSTAMGEKVANVVLPGFSVFDPADARTAGLRLLRDGAVRLKETGGVGGGGQSVVHNEAELMERLAAFDAGLLRREGLVLERNLRQVETYSVGQVMVGPWRATYWGRQRLTRNHHGHEVYGGSDLTVVRGGYADLLNLALSDEVRLAVEQALVYHESALSSFPDMFASRCNYDVAQGVDDAGERRSGVLEQSWRIGGASGAEVAALLAFKADPRLHVVQASTHEVYEAGVRPPADARINFSRVDDQVGHLTKYVRVSPHGHV